MAIKEDFSIEDIVPNQEYSILCNQLARLNSIVNKPVDVYDPDKSSITRFKNKFLINSPTTGNDKYYFGVVVDIRDSLKLPSVMEVFVDVPGINSKKVNHPDFFGNENLDLQYFEDMIFYYFDTYAIRTNLPVQGGIAVVQVSKFYPNHRTADRYGNRFIGMVYSTPYITVNKDVDRIQFKGNPIQGYFGGGGYQLGNSGEVGNLLNRSQAEEITKRYQVTADLQSLIAVYKDAADGIEAAKRNFISGMSRLTQADLDCYRRAAARTGANLDLLMAINMIESAYSSTVISTAGAMGMGQVMPGTYNRLFTKDPEFKKLMIENGITNPNLDETVTIPSGDNKGTTFQTHNLAREDRRCAAIHASAYIIANQSYDASLTKTKVNPDPIATAMGYNGGEGRIIGYSNTVDGKKVYFPGLKGNGYKGMANPDRGWYTANAANPAASKRGNRENTIYPAKVLVALELLDLWRTNAGTAPAPSATADKPAGNPTPANSANVGAPGETNRTTVGSSSEPEQEPQEQEGANQSLPEGGQSRRNGSDGNTGSPPMNRPKLILVNFTPDQATSNNILNSGSKIIKVREDIAGDLQKVKDILNFYNIPLSLIGSDINLKNKFLSKIEMLGLQIKLNPNCGLNDFLNEKMDDYFIGPDRSVMINGNYKIKIYGNIKNKILKEHDKYKIYNKPIEVYDISTTKNITKPNIIKILRPVIDVTSIFQDHGFVSLRSDNEFYNKSIVEKSNWNVFFKPSKINIGDTYKQALEHVYFESNDSIWRFSNKKWDGEDFI